MSQETVHFLDRPMRNYVHYTLCYVGASATGHKLSRCACWNCPFLACRFRTDRRHPGNNRRVGDHEKRRKTDHGD